MGSDSFDNRSYSRLPFKNRVNSVFLLELLVRMIGPFYFCHKVALFVVDDCLKLEVNPLFLNIIPKINDYGT